MTSVLREDVQAVTMGKVPLKCDGKDGLEVLDLVISKKALENCERRAS